MKPVSPPARVPLEFWTCIHIQALISSRLSQPGFLPFVFELRDFTAGPVMTKRVQLAIGLLQLTLAALAKSAWKIPEYDQLPLTLFNLTDGESEARWDTQGSASQEGNVLRLTTEVPWRRKALYTCYWRFTDNVGDRIKPLLVSHGVPRLSQPKTGGKFICLWSATGRLYSSYSPSTSGLLLVACITCTHASPSRKICAGCSSGSTSQAMNGTQGR